MISVSYSALVPNQNLSPSKFLVIFMNCSARPAACCANPASRNAFAANCSALAAASLAIATLASKVSSVIACYQVMRPSLTIGPAPCLSLPNPAICNPSVEYSILLSSVKALGSHLSNDSL